MDILNKLFNDNGELIKIDKDMFFKIITERQTSRFNIIK